MVDVYWWLAVVAAAGGVVWSGDWSAWPVFAWMILGLSAAAVLVGVLIWWNQPARSGESG